MLFSCKKYRKKGNEKEMNRLRAPPVVANRKKQQKISSKIEIDTRKDMTMNPKNKKGKRLTSAIMAVLMSVSATITPVNSMASEVEIFASVESTMEETTLEERVQITEEMQEDTETQTAMQETQAIAEQTTEATVQTETESTVVEETETTGENAEESEANETRGPDKEEAATQETEQTIEEITETETTSEELPSIDLADATKEEILSYIEAIGGNDSDAFYAFVGSLSEDDYRLVWMAQYGAEKDQLAEKFDFDYDGSSDLEVAKYIHKLTEDELGDFVENMTFEQYRRYLSVREMMAEMDEKDFSDVVDGEEFDADRTWDYESYDAFAESLTGVSLQRTEQNMQFYNTYVDPSQVQAGVTTIDGLLDSNADWYSNDYILGLNPEMFKETVPVYYGSDGNYYVVSTVPTLNGIESADYQPATNFYNGSVEAQAFTDIEYLGNGVYRIPNSRYQYCFTEQYVSDMGTLYGISFGLRIQVLYGFPSSDEITIAADVVYPDMTERFLPAVLNLSAGTATVRVFNDDYDDSTDNYLVSASVNRGASLPDSVGSMNNGKVLQFVVNDANAVGSLDILIGYNATSKYSMAAEVTTQELYASQTTDVDISLAAEMYNGAYLKLDKNSVPKDLAVGDKFIYANTGLTIVGVNTATDGSGATHVGASVVPTHDSQFFCFYNGKGVDSQISSWFKTQLNTNSADPGYMVQMTTENISARASYNGSSVNLGGNQIFGYVTDGLGAVTGTSGNTLNLEGTNVLLACMHAWGNESATTPQDIVTSVSNFTGRTQMDYAADEGFGHYHPNVALQCTEVHDGGDGYTYATFKVVTSMLHVGGIAHAENYQCAFSTLCIAYPSAPKTGYLQIHKSSSNPEITNGNSCYNFAGIQYGIFTDEACVNNLVVLSLDANGYSQPYELPEGTYYVREADATPGSGYKTNGTVYTVNVTAGTTVDAPVTCETVDQPLNDPLGIVINKINGDGTTTADLSGAEYTITYYPKQYNSVAEIEVETDPEVKPTVWVIQTLKATNGNYGAMLDDEHIISGSAIYGKSQSGEYIIPLGTITVEETKAPAGFTVDGATVSSAKTGATISETNNVYLFQLVDENSAVYLKSGNALSTSVDDETAITLTYAEVQNKAGIRIAKYDASTGGAASGDADLSGIKFAIVNNTGSAIINYAGDSIENGAVAQVVTTDSNGYAATGANDLPIGNYIVRELRQDAAFDGKNFHEGTSALANGSYQWQDNQDTVTLTDSDAGQLVWAKAFYNAPVTGVPVMEKHDLELNKKAAMGGTSFEGITFEIYNYSDTPVVVGGVSYAKGEVVATAVSDAEGNITTTATFPVGHYSMKEKSVNNQYTMTEGETHYFNVVSHNGAAFIQYEPGNQAVIFKDRVVRGDLSFVKKNSETDEALACVPFKITNNATGETHYILTDADGNFTSATGKTNNTNANDEILSQYGEKDVIPQNVIDSLAKDAGLWFGMDSEGTMTDAKDSYGAFVYGTYSITELKTEATRNMKMYTNTVTIDTDGKVLDLGTVNNIPMGIETTLVDVDGEHFTEALSNVVLTDHVSYRNLETDKVYTLTGTLYVKDGDALTELMTETVDFQPTETTGTQDVTFTFNASALVGKSVVAFEELSLNGEFCAEHKDKDDENQTVTFPNIQTTAHDNITEDHVSNATDSITIIDTVTYTGLKVGETYEITGTLMDADTGKPAFDDDGNEITASKEFTAPAADGSVNITFTFAGVSLAGKTLVAFEDIYHDGRRYAVHADINDKNQTVYIPEIHTKALDANTGLNQVLADSNATVVDTVTYKHLLPGRTYTMKGILMTSAGNALMVNGKTITASTEFVPTTPDGTVNVTFNFDASEIGGRKFVFYEYLELDGNTVASHTDISDTDQTVYVPGIKTTILDDKNGSHNSAADEEITLVDTVRYNGVEVGRKYTVVGTLVDKETGEAFLDDAGNKITASNEFVAEKANGTIDITFKFSGVCLAGKITVAFEEVYSEGKKVAVHADLRDEGQTEYFPSVHTTATSNDTEDHVVGANEKVTITDQVALRALKLGTEYTLSGILMNAKTGKPIAVNGATITARRTFTADAHEMTIPLTYTMNASELAGTTTVVFENLYSDGALLAQHEDLKDDDQMVSIPKIHTTAKDKITGINHTESAKTATIIDTVFYSNLLPNRSYVVSGKLMNKATGEPIVIGGKEVTASTTFTPTKEEGSVDVTFLFDATAVAPETVVVYETLTYKDIKLAAHEEISDAKQTVYIPTIKTSAISDDTKDHITKADNEITMTDTVSYKGLEVGREYQLQATLMNCTAGKAITSAGKTVTASTTFTPKAKDGTVNVTFKFDGTGLEDTITVVFERLYTEGKEVAIHEDLSDENQAVYLPKIRTNAADAITTINHTEAKPKAKIIDSVKYSSVLVGKEYTVTGKLINKATGKAILLNGKEITASTTFKAEKTSGSVDVVFEFDASVLEGTTVVAYESMTYKGVEVAIHADITDKDQTVYIPKVRTTAIGSATKDHVTEAKKDVTIVDTVSYEGLEVGREYTVKGVLMNKATGKAVTVNGKEITAESTFTAKAQKGTVDVTFKFDGSALEDTLLVAFETLYTENKEVGVHADIKDDAQTVYLPKIRTNAEDAVTEINHTEAKPKAKIIDTVTYSSLLPGKEYTLTGTLMNKATGKPILLNGKEITASTTFKAEKSSGSVQVVFEFDASVLEGTTVVAYESMTYKGVEVAIHADITDKNQTVYIPKVRTTAIGSDTKDHVTEAKKDVTIVDIVSYEGLEVDREYTVKGVLMNKTTGKAITVNGKEVTAESTFTAKAQKGTVDVTFKFDGSALEDTLLVAFETLYTENKEVGVHADIKDDAQTVYLPKIRTHAKDQTTEIDHTEALEKTTIIDAVTYSSLLPGKEYTIKGTLMNKETGEAVLINGEPITAETTFTAEKSSGSVDLIFTFEASAIAGTTVVAFESVEYKGIEVGVHADITDEDQTVYIPDVHTTATAANTTQDHVTGANEDLIITDEVVLTGLKIGNEYTVKGVLMDQTTGKELMVNDETITAEVTFTADERDMTVTLTYTLDASKLAGTTTVVFETLYTEDKEVGKHHEIKDEGQSVYIPEIRTTAADKVTEINHTEANEKATIVDTVLYTHLLPGKEYTVKGTLMNKATGEPILINDEPITAETNFTPETPDGSVDVIFTFDASKIAGTTIVAFETLEYQGIEVAAHADIEDKDQTVYVPDIHTTAVGEDTKDHIEKAMEKAVIVDTVAYKGLEIGREYTVKGTLMDRETREPLVINEEEVVAETTFTPETTDGSVDVTFTFDASVLAGKTYVAFETLYTEGKEVAIHTDIEDEDQTVFIPDVYTTATDKVTGDHDGVVAEETTVLDEVFYKNLIPGKEYTVSGKLMVKETGEPLLVDGKEVTAKKTFVAEEADGSIIIEFTFNSLALAGKHVVAFEDLTYEGISIASHEDLEDEDQTISYPEIHTTAADQTSGSKTMPLGSSVIFVDTVTYKGLTAGKTYVVKGTIMDKASGESIGVTAETTFTAEAADGSVEVTFTFDTTKLQGKTLVVFETLYDEQGTPIVDHSDLTDEDQTVSVPVQPEIPPVITGDDSSPMPYVFGLTAAVLVAMVSAVALIRKRKNQK